AFQPAVPPTFSRLRVPILINPISRPAPFCAQQARDLRYSRLESPRYRSVAQAFQPAVPPTFSRLRVPILINPISPQGAVLRPAGQRPAVQQTRKSALPQCSAGFPACCTADFQSAARPHTDQPDFSPGRRSAPSRPETCGTADSKVRATAV